MIDDIVYCVGAAVVAGSSLSLSMPAFKPASSSMRDEGAAMTRAVMKDDKGRGSQEAAAAERSRRNRATYLRRKPNG
jgi:hypothetical protein